jgi:hypothetical protein
MKCFLHVLLLGIGVSAVAVPLDVAGSQFQKPLVVKGKRYTVRELDKRVCDAHTRQWAGSVDVGDEKSLFYCA